MQKNMQCTIVICSTIAGAINGLFGAGGGILLVPLLVQLTDLEESEIFPTSVTIITPLCLISLFLSQPSNVFSWNTVFPYLCGSAAGGILSGLLGRKIPTRFLHKFLGIMILWGGTRYLW